MILAVSSSTGTADQEPWDGAYLLPFLTFVSLSRIIHVYPSEVLGLITY